MRRRATIGALAVVLVTAAALPATAAPGGDGPGRSDDRFEQVSPRSGKIVRLPQTLRRDKVVHALVELSGEPVVKQLRRSSGPRALSRQAAERKVRANQAAALPRLKAAGAETYGRLSTVLNAVQVRVKVADLDKVAAVPGVKTVQVSQLVRRDNAAAERYTGVDRTWQDLSMTGKGQVIGIIDSGVDYTHADFGGPGTVAAYKSNDPTVIESGSFPTAKVTGGYDFVGNAYDASAKDQAKTVPKPDPDPLDCGGHGSHVAGTAAGSGVTSSGKTYAGPYNRAALRQTFDVAPGVAPQATIKAYKVFGCAGAVNDDIIVAAIDRAVADGVGVLNLSLGAPFGTADNLDNVAIENATQAGVLVVTAAGNAGAGAYLVDAPSTSNAALSVAAIDAEYPRFPGVGITGAVQAQGINANDAPIPKPITGQLVDVGLGCAAKDYTGVKGKIALSTRGICPRIDRATLGQQAGALAVIMINDQPGLPPFEHPIPGVTIPFVGVRGDASATFKAAKGKKVTLRRSSPIPNPNYTRTADFSSNGPRRLDNAPKPDVAAPGADIPSAAVGTGTGSIRYSGTSMATPHTAGVAALVRQAHPRWFPLEVKAAIMSTAAPERIGDYDSQRVGTGLVQPRRAAVAATYAWTPDQLNSLAFGLNELNGAHVETQSFRITNKSSRAVSYTLRSRLSSKRLGAQVSISPRTLRVGAGQTRTVSVTIRMSAADVARLPGADAFEAGRINSLHGLIVATPRGSRPSVLPLRISFLFVPVPVSNVVAEPSVTLTASGAGHIRVHNDGVHAGTADVYSWLLSDPAGDAKDPEVADLTHLGVQALPGTAVGAAASDRLLVFAAAQATGTSTHATREVDVGLDVDRDGKPDFVTFAADTGLVRSGSPDGTVTAFTVAVATRKVVDSWTAVAPANGSTVQLPVLASRLGITASTGPVGVTATGSSVVSDAAADEMTGNARFDPFAPALTAGQYATVRPGQTTSIPVRVNLTQLVRQTHAGWLVVSLDDQAGRPEADPVRLVAPSGTKVPLSRSNR